MLELRFYSKKDLEDFYKKYPEGKEIIEKLSKKKGEERIIWENNEEDNTNFVQVLSEMDSLDNEEKMSEAFREVEYDTIQLNY